MKIIYKVLLISILGLLLVAAGKTPALAQTENQTATFQNVHLWLNPEYDDLRLLVMLEGQIAGVQPPIGVRFLVPSDAEMYSAGSKDAQGNYKGGPPARQPSSISGWDEISYELTAPIFRVEYYTSAIIGQSDKTISYEFLRLYPVNSLQVIVQQPRLATNFTVSPAGRPFVDSEGFNTSVYSYADLATDTPIRFQISYTKADPRPSLNITGTGSSNTTLAAVMVIVALVLAIVGIFVWRGKPRKQNRAARRQELKKAAGKQPSGQPKSRFCAQCGKPLEKSDVFCTYCGSRLP